MQNKNILTMIFNEIKCHINTSTGLVGGCILCTPCVRACVFSLWWDSGEFDTVVSVGVELVSPTMAYMVGDFFRVILWVSGGHEIF